MQRQIQDPIKHQTSRRHLTVIIQSITSQDSLHQKFDRVLNFSKKDLMLIAGNISS